MPEVEIIRQTIVKDLTELKSELMLQFNSELKIKKGSNRSYHHISQI